MRTYGEGDGEDEIEDGGEADENGKLLERRRLCASEMWESLEMDRPRSRFRLAELVLTNMAVESS